MENSKSAKSILSNEEIEKIKNEEITRFRIRDELKPGKDKKSFWNFLNSNLGIWLLSSVALGLITWGYATLTEEKKSRKQRTDIIYEIDAELAYRIDDFEMRLLQAKNIITVDNAIHDFIIYENQPPSGIKSIQDLNTRALIIKQNILLGYKEKQSFINALIGIHKIKDIYGVSISESNMTRGQAYNDTLDAETIKKMKAILFIVSDQVKMPRWRLDNAD